MKRLLPFVLMLILGLIAGSFTAAPLLTWLRAAETVRPPQVAPELIKTAQFKLGLGGAILFLAAAAGPSLIARTSRPFPWTLAYLAAGVAFSAALAVEYRNYYLSLNIDPQQDVSIESFVIDNAPLLGALFIASGLVLSCGLLHRYVAIKMQKAPAAPSVTVPAEG